MPFVFSADRVKAMRAKPDQVYAVLIPTSGLSVGARRKLRGERILRPLIHEYVQHDADGVVTGTTTGPVIEVVDGERHRVPITLLSYETVDVYEGKGLSRPLARACGCKDVAELRSVWMETHPRTPFAIAVHFTIGDKRDLTHLLRRNVSRGGDYATHAADDVIDDLESPTPQQLGAMAAGNRQRHARRVVGMQLSMAAQTDAERLEHIQRAGEEQRLNLRRELGVSRERIERMERARESRQ